MSEATDNKMLVSMTAFKKNDIEMYLDHEDVLEVTDATSVQAEIAFDHVRGERIYIRVNVSELMRLIHAHGRDK